MNKRKVKTGILVGAMLSLIMLVGCNNIKKDKKTETPNIPVVSQDTNNTKDINLKDALNNAKSVKLERDFTNVGTFFNVYADNELVGNMFSMNADEHQNFELKDLKGEVLKSENQINIKNNKEDSSYIFHFYDENQKEIASTKIGNSSKNNIFNVYDKKGELDYEVKVSPASIIGSDYEIAINDKSDVSVEDMLLYTAIRDRLEEYNK